MNGLVVERNVLPTLAGCTGHLARDGRDALAVDNSCRVQITCCRTRPDLISAIASFINHLDCCSWARLPATATPAGTVGSRKSARAARSAFGIARP